MPTAFPNALDSYTTKLDGVSDVLAADTNNLQDAMVAVQTRIGTTAAPNFVTLATTQTITGNKTITGITFLNGTQRATNLLVGQADTLVYEDTQNTLAIRTGASGAYRYALFAANGNFSAQGDITSSSDERLKTNWRELPANFLTELANVKMGVYDRVDTSATQVGVSAQSLQGVLPWAVGEGTNGMLSVAYGSAALSACIALAREVVSLRRELDELKGA